MNTTKVTVWRVTRTMVSRRCSRAARCFKRCSRTKGSSISDMASAAGIPNRPYPLIAGIIRCPYALRVSSFWSCMR